jgi:hypothetical protein
MSAAVETLAIVAGGLVVVLYFGTVIAVMLGAFRR